MFKVVWVAAALVAGGIANVHAQAAAPASPAKKELVAKVLQLQQGGIEAMARQLTEQPALQLMQAAGAALQRLPQERREAVGRDIEADLRKYAEEANPIVRDRALKLAPSTIGAVLEERFNEDELKQLVAMFETLQTPVARKFQQLQPDFQRAIGEKLVAETRGDVEPKLRSLEASVKARLGPALGAASAPAAKPAAPAKK